MDQQQQLAQIISSADNAQFYRLIQNSRSRITTGMIKLAQFSETRTHFINIDKFCQNIIPGTPFVYLSSEKGLTLIFPHIEQGLNGIFIPQSEQLLTFQGMLNSVVQMVPFEQAMQIQQFKDTIEIHCKDIATVPLDSPSEVNQYIAKGGEYLKIGFTFLGSALASGINKGGQYLSSKVEPGQKPVDPETKSKFENVKGKVSGALDVTGDFLSQLFKPISEKTKEVTESIGHKIDASDNNILKQTKSLTCATWDAAGTALSGLGDALSQVGDSIGTQTKTIVQKKYGPEVVETYLGKPIVQNDQVELQQQLHEPLIEEREPEQQQQQQQTENPYPAL